MDLIPIDYYDSLADLEGVPFDNWFIYDWENYVISYKFEDKYDIGDICFTLGDDHIELTNCSFKEEPYTDISHTFEGSLKTLFMIATIHIKDGLLKGDMCIRNKSESPKHTDFELHLKEAEMKMTVGLLICGDSLDYDHCKYKFPKVNLSFHYSEDSQKKSVFDKITSTNEKKLLEQYMLEYITKDLGPSIEFFMLCRLNIKTLVSDFVGCCYKSRNILRIHNRWLHTAFDNLTREIISLANSLIQENLPKLLLERIFGLSKEENDEKVLKVYKGFLTGLDTLIMLQNKNVIVSYKGDTVFLHAPIEFEKLCLNFTEVVGGVNKPDNNFNKVQELESEGAHFILALEKLNENKVKFELTDFRIIFLKPSSNEHRVSMTIDHLILHAIEESIKPYLKKVLENDKLHELAIKPDIEIEYYSDDFETEYSDDEMFG